MNALPEVTPLVIESTPLYSYRDRLPWPVWALYRAMRTVAVTSAFAGFWVGGVILSSVVLPIVAMLASSRKGGDPIRACQRILRASFRLFHGYMRALRLFDAKPITMPALRTPSVLIANHTTLVDVTAILSQVPDVCCVSKHSFTDSWFIGRLLKLCGFLGAGSTMVEQAAMLAEAQQRLAQGFHVLVFPEGTRSPERSLLPFRRGAFEIACQANVPLIPLVLRCDPSALRSGQRFWQQPDLCADLDIEVDPAVLPSDFQNKSRAMRQTVEAYYRSRLGLRDPRGQ